MNFGAVRWALVISCCGLHPVPGFSTTATPARIYGDSFETTACTALSGQACDGDDVDRCSEGVIQCNAGVAECSDRTTSNPEVCNGLDDDCDAATADGSGDPLIGAGCDGSDDDQCVEGVQQCLVGAPMCSDLTSSTAEQCNELDDDCDGVIDDGSLQDTNPPCANAIQLADLEGDSGTPARQVTGRTEAWYRLKVFEASDLFKDLTATVRLTPGPNTNFDLHAYCGSCGDTLIASSTQAGATIESIELRHQENGFVEDHMTILLEIRYVSGQRCTPWTLEVNGNTVVAAPAQC